MSSDPKTRVLGWYPFADAGGGQNRYGVPLDELRFPDAPNAGRSVITRFSERRFASLQGGQWTVMDWDGDRLSFVGGGTRSPSYVQPGSVVGYGVGNGAIGSHMWVANPPGPTVAMHSLWRVDPDGTTSTIFDGVQAPSWTDEREAVLPGIPSSASYALEVTPGVNDDLWLICRMNQTATPSQSELPATAALFVAHVNSSGVVDMRPSTHGTFMSEQSMTGRPAINHSLSSITVTSQPVAVGDTLIVPAMASFAAMAGEHPRYETHGAFLVRSDGSSSWSSMGVAVGSPALGFSGWPQLANGVQSGNVVPFTSPVEAVDGNRYLGVGVDGTLHAEAVGEWGSINSFTGIPAPQTFMPYGMPADRATRAVMVHSKETHYTQREYWYREASLDGYTPDDAGVERFVFDLVGATSWPEVGAGLGSSTMASIDDFYAWSAALQGDPIVVTEADGYMAYHFDGGAFPGGKTDATRTTHLADTSSGDRRTGIWLGSNRLVWLNDYTALIFTDRLPYVDWDGEVPDDWDYSFTENNLSNFLLVVEFAPMDVECRQLAAHTDYSGDLTIVDITDFENPIVTSVLEAGDFGEWWYHSSTWAGGALLARGNLNIEVFDVSDPFNPELVLTFDFNYNWLGLGVIYGNNDDLFILKDSVDGGSFTIEWWDASEVLAGTVELIDVHHFTLAEGEDDWVSDIVAFEDSILVSTGGPFRSPGYDWTFRAFSLDRDSRTIVPGSQLISERHKAGWANGEMTVAYLKSSPVVAVNVWSADGLREGVRTINFRDPSQLTSNTFFLPENVRIDSNAPGFFDGGFLLPVSIQGAGWWEWVTDLDGNVLHSEAGSEFFIWPLLQALPNRGPFVARAGDGLRLLQPSGSGIHEIGRAEFPAYIGEGPIPLFSFSPPCIVEREGCVGCWYVGMIGIGEFKTATHQPPPLTPLSI